jgi:hypothetical protein
MNHRRHLVLIIVPALILVAPTALYPGHFFYPSSNQLQSVQTAPSIIFDNFLPIPDDRDPVIETRFCLNSDHYYFGLWTNISQQTITYWKRCFFCLFKTLLKSGTWYY